ncbi:MAG: tRNA (adenosine(37)-N6)-threonylcarbamoyltransferase complex ATPase subunit type 1 TsaE [Anaerovoracaceae bacterium]
MRNIKIRSEEETREFGLALGKALKPGQIVALIGNLGTGKTTLTKYIAQGMGISELITSPTFNIVQEYHDGRLPLYHFDTYRIDDVEEMFEIGYEEYFFGQGVCIIEWADQIEEIIPAEAWTIYLDYGKEEGGRIYKCTF